MSVDDDIRALAEQLHTRLFDADPFSASYLGIPAYDALVPDASAAAEDALAAELRGVMEQATTLAGQAETGAARVTAGAVHSAAERTVLGIEARVVEHVVSPMPFAGPADLLAVAARTVIGSPESAADYVTRLRGSGAYVDQLVERLEEGAARGRLPVASMAQDTLRWFDVLTADGVPAAFTTPTAPDGWDGAEAWRAEVEDAVRSHVLPALVRWRDTVADLLPRARDDDHAGLAHIPGGEQDYAKLLQLHTTLPLTAEQLHQTGLEQIAELEDRAREIGARIGLTDLAAVLDAIRGSAGGDPQAAMAAARDAVRRAEARAHEVFPAPLPPPCAVEPMPAAVADAGTAPHYTPPRLDGTRPGTYWCNTAKPTAGGGWDLEAVAFHEAVPGHHLQLSRQQLHTHLPDLQRLRGVTVHAEGWGLYSEQLAEEMGLYSDDRQLLGAVTASLMRAARLVLDTGLHHFGWSRQRAIDYYVEHVPLPREFLVNEVDRYLVMPGQALAYMTGKLELLRLREDAQRRLGDAFDLPAFHAAVLDSGSLPLPVLATAVDDWVTATAA